ncbi:MAG TPA: hypothetical protein VHG28_07080 [Longimicrobiaceae bacterium]|nr:hypothetical protein [Longimicrobiaceae bacterium]
MTVSARLLLLLAVCLGLPAGCGAPAEGRAVPDAARELRRGRRWEAALLHRTRGVAVADSVAPEAALALGYLERLRLGMGSPFRLAEQALRDPRLADTLRPRLAWALLARTLDGRAYAVEMEALDPLTRGPYGPIPGRGGVHRERIEAAVERARDPRAGEAAVRMAYRIAAAGGDASPSAPMLAARAAALLRDRRLAREDARALLRAADSARASPLELIPAWRAGRRFRVEAPLLLPHGADAEREATRAALHLAAEVRATWRARAEPGAPRDPGLLGPGAAARLAALADSADLPPQPPVTVSVGAFRESLLAGAPDGAPWRRFLERAGNEERFAAELALLRHAGIGGPGPGVVALAVAVSLRSYAQEPVWFPGLPAPTERELRTAYGIAQVRFDRSVPAAWHPYALRMLEGSLRDLAQVFPTFQPAGLRVRFGATQRADALATHTPRTRTLTLPLATAAGTLAHELAHDLDWQAARARYGVRGTYRTDRAVRFRRDHLAAAVRALAAGPLELPDPATGRRPSPDRRPAEVFARHADWFVAASLARRGVSNGYLSAVQDATLTGYAGAAAPDAEGRSAEAVVRILGEVAAIPPEEARWFLEQYGPDRSPSPEEVVRAILEPPLPEQGATGAPAAREEGAGACGTAPREVLGEDPLLRELAALAARARARGVALEQAERLAGPAGRAWLARQAGGLLWSPLPVDSATVERLDPLVREVVEPEPASPFEPRGGSPFTVPGARCAPGAAG